MASREKKGMNEELSHKSETSFDKAKYKVWTWKNPTMLHWVVNPGIAFNELVLGQRIPKVMLIEKNSDKTFAEKTFIPCPHCHTIHSGFKWSSQNKTAFKNWFGYYCDNCGQIIPCLTNLTTYLILGITLPFWYFFKDSLREKWLKGQKEKFSQPMILTPPEFKWWKAGLRYGALMFVFMAIINSFIFKREMSFETFMFDLITWAIGGLFFGLFMKLMITNKEKF